MLMDFRWWDHRAEWQEHPYLSVLKRLVAMSNATRIDKKEVPDNSLVFVHPGEIVENWKNAAARGARGVVVFVSREPHTRENLPPNVYCLERDENDFIESGDAEGFIQSCKEGAPKWDLLKTTVRYEELIALYLLLLAATQLGRSAEFVINALGADKLKDAVAQFNEVATEPQRLEPSWRPNDGSLNDDVERIGGALRKRLGGRPKIQSVKVNA